MRVVLVVLAAFSWMAYTEIRDSALRAAETHLDRGARQLATVIAAGVPRNNDAIKAAAGNAAVGGGQPIRSREPWNYGQPPATALPPLVNRCLHSTRHSSPRWDRRRLTR